MRAQLIAGIRMLFVMTILVGVIYPLAVWGVSQSVFHEQANGSLVKVDGRIVGSRLIGQEFPGKQWFHSRPSSAGNGYDATASGASNLGPTNNELATLVQQRAQDYRKENGLSQNVIVPIDAVTASASGLDPDISLANAELQAGRVAHENGLTSAQVKSLVHTYRVKDWLSFGGQDRINVLSLNIALAKLTN